MKYELLLPHYSKAGVCDFRHFTAQHYDKTTKNYFHIQYILIFHGQCVQNLRQVKCMCYTQSPYVPAVAGNAFFLEETVVVLTKKFIYLSARF
jgi:uncharacterized sodium:solute symporter family permease YidK